MLARSVKRNKDELLKVLNFMEFGENKTDAKNTEQCEGTHEVTYPSEKLVKHSENCFFIS